MIILKAEIFHKSLNSGDLAVLEKHNPGAYHNITMGMRQRKVRM
jgi:hypothetical protein